MSTEILCNLIQNQCLNQHGMVMEKSGDVLDELVRADDMDKIASS